jgi:hypothetical protein
MTNRREWLPAAGLLATMGIAIYMVVQLTAQSAPLTGDFSNAANAEVRDAQGQVILSGPFAAVDEEDEDIERKAALKPTGIDPDAAGEAEVEFAKAGAAEQEIEFSIRNVQPGATFTFGIDGHDVATAKADSRGRAEVEIDVKSAPAGAVR